MRRLFLGTLLLAAAGGAHADDSYGWGSGGAGSGLGAGGLIGGSYYGTLVAGKNGGLVGVSQTHMWVTDSRALFFGPDDHSNIKETSVFFGGLFAKRHAYWSLGAARVELDGSHCYAQEQQVNCVTGGLTGAIAFELPNRTMGVELRFAGNANSVQSFAGFFVGLHFGSSLHDTWEAVDSPARSRNPRWLDEPRPADAPAPRPQERSDAGVLYASAAPASQGQPGQSAKLKERASLRGRPTGDGEVLAIPAVTAVTLKSSLHNPEGTWWYVDAGGTQGWMRADDLEFSGS